VLAYCRLHYETVTNQIAASDDATLITNTNSLKEAVVTYRGTVVVLRADSPGKAAQWFAESIPES
jgi:hypothetical protein